MNTDIIEVKPARSSALKKAQKNYRLRVNQDPIKRNAILLKKKEQYQKKINKNKEDKETIDILKDDVKTQHNTINTLEEQKLQLIELKKIIDNLLIA